MSLKQEFTEGQKDCSLYTCFCTIKLDIKQKVIAFNAKRGEKKEKNMTYESKIKLKHSVW